MNFKYLVIASALLMFSGVASAENPDNDDSIAACPGCVTWVSECQFTCDAQGYSISVQRPADAPAGTHLYQIVVNKSGIHEFGDSSEVISTFGSMQALPSQGNVTLYDTNQSLNDDPLVCNRNGQILTGRIYEWWRTNTYSFSSGQTGDLHDSNVCIGLTLSSLRNQYIAQTGLSIPQCTDYACSLGPGGIEPSEPDDLGPLGIGADNQPIELPEGWGNIEGTDTTPVVIEAPHDLERSPPTIDPNRPISNDERQAVDPPSPGEPGNPTVATRPDSVEVDPSHDGIWQRIQRLFGPRQTDSDEAASDSEGEQEDPEARD